MGEWCFDFPILLSPIAVSGSRDTPAIPPSVAGTGFGDATVRAVFRARALQLAASVPDVLGLGTEVNLLAANGPEFAANVSLFQETVAAVHAQHPTQRCTASFQWDRMILSPQDFSALVTFRDLASDGPGLFAFTTYPHVFGQASPLPDVTLFTGPLEPLNRTGVRHVDGSPKPAWDVLRGLNF